MARTGEVKKKISKKIHSQQFLNSISITKLKDLRNVDIDFTESPLIAIMGVNGVGKSTVLHALACCYSLLENEDKKKKYNFRDFFLPNTFALWDDSEFKVNLNYQETILYSDENGKYIGKDCKSHDKEEIVYKKGESWTPRYSRRPQRHVTYIGIDSCVPDIESQTTKSFIKLEAQEQQDELSNKILQACTLVLNIPYEKLAICKAASKYRKSTKEYLGVQRKRIGYCTSLSMGAGEQRVFKILSEVYRSPKNSLVLIDELDLLLHENALRRMIEKLKEIADENKLQIIFTTHSMVMETMSEYVKIRYLRQTAEKTLLQTAISTDICYQLTGEMQRPIKIYVEDKLSKTIINILCQKIGCKRKVEVFIFGAASNAFTVMAGRELNDELDDKMIAVTDGDVYRTDKARMDWVGKLITGQDEIADRRRQRVLQSVLMYNLPEGKSPEQYIRESIISLPYDILSEDDELRIVLEEIETVKDKHECINAAIERLDLEYMVGLSKFIELFSKTPEWESHTAAVGEWIQETIKKL